MRVFAGSILCALMAAAAAAASAMPPADDLLGNNSMALKDSPSIAGRPADVQGQPATATDLAQSQPELAAIMDKIEGVGRLPQGAAPLAAYARYYAWADIQKTKVTAIYVRGDAPGRRWIEFDDLPMIDDGGCGVIELVYDVKRGGLDEIYCHGLG